MEHRWLAEDAARSLMEQTDQQRAQFYQAFFGVDWTSPLGYHVTVNTGRMQPAGREPDRPHGGAALGARGKPEERRGSWRRNGMEIGWGTATVWMGLALLASFISIQRG